MHLNLFGPSRTMSIRGNYYALIIVDDYSRYICTFFVSLKSNAFKAFQKLAKIIQNEKDLKIKALRSDHRAEFQNKDFETFCEEIGINNNFSASRTPQEKGIVERKTMPLEELVKTMLNENDLPKYFWTNAVDTTLYVLNRVLIRPLLKLTPYEIYKGRKPNISHIKVFGLNNGK